MMKESPLYPSHPPTQMMDDLCYTFWRRLKSQKNLPDFYGGWMAHKQPCPLSPAENTPAPPASQLDHSQLFLPNSLSTRSLSSQQSSLSPPHSRTSSVKYLHCLQVPSCSLLKLQAALTPALVGHHWPPGCKTHWSTFSSHAPAPDVVDSSFHEKLLFLLLGKHHFLLFS